VISVGDWGNAHVRIGGEHSCGATFNLGRSKETNPGGLASLRETTQGTSRPQLSPFDRLLARRPDGIFLSDFEQGEIGPDLFRKACEFGLEGLVCKRRDRPYRASRPADWIKVKNRQHHAFERVMDSFG
jgi:hypothetical protein